MYLDATYLEQMVMIRMNGMYICRNYLDRILSQLLSGIFFLLDSDQWQKCQKISTESVLVNLIHNVI